MIRCPGNRDDDDDDDDEIIHMIMVEIRAGNVDGEVVGLDDGRRSDGTEAGPRRMLQTLVCGDG